MLLPVGKERLLLDTEGPSDALITGVLHACFNPQPKLCSRCLTPKRTLHKAHWEQAHQLFPSVHYTQPPCNPSVLLSRDKDGQTWHFDASSEQIDDLKWIVCASTMTAQLQNVLFCNICCNIHFVSKLGEKHHKSVFRPTGENKIHDLSENQSWKADSELPVMD